MPPIFGIINTNLRPINPEQISQITAAATYIKPRQILMWAENGYLFATAVTNKQGKEVAVERSWMCIADGTIYKPEQVEKQNLASQHILKTWLRWKDDCVKHLYGDFAFVVFNSQTGEIFCGRDNLGVRPLFYRYTNDTFIFASELRLILAVLPQKPVVSKEYLLDTLVTKKSIKSQTPYDNIYRLCPAHYLKIKDSKLTTDEYWQPDPGERIILSSENEFITLFRDKLINAVKVRCTGDHVATELSGGLDSSAVTGIAAEIIKNEDKNLNAYSNVFPEGTDIEYKDERQFIGDMAGFTALKWTGIDRLNQAIPKLLQYVIQIQGCYPQQNFSIFSRALYEAAVKENIQVLLSGFGGDEMVSARTAFPWNELIHEGQWKSIKDELFSRDITIKSPLKPLILTVRYIKSLLDMSAYTSGVFTKKMLDRRMANIPIKSEFAAMHQLRQRLADQYKKKKRSKLAWRQFDWIMHDHLPQRLEYCYAAAAQYGIEYRYPLLDKDLIETALAFPPWLKFHHGVNRYMFREAIKGFVPESIRLRDDKSRSTIPQTYYSLVTEREEIMSLINEASKVPFLNEIFDFSRFPEWYEKLVKRNPKEMNYLMPGAFYSYLMIMLYYLDRDKGRGTRDK